MYAPTNVPAGVRNMLQRRLRYAPLRGFPKVFSHILGCWALPRPLREKPANALRRGCAA